MKRLDEATDVVCLLTHNSTNRPWILYEAGVAKGKLNTTLLGIALGISITEANKGPFAQFQNCADDIESLTKLVLQLVKRIPNSEPDEEIIRIHVNKFLENAKEEGCFDEIAVSAEEVVNTNSDVTKLFEEIKIMYSELPKKISFNVKPRYEKDSFQPVNIRVLDEILYIGDKKFKNRFTMYKIVLSFFRDSYPWVYESGKELVSLLTLGSNSKSSQTQRIRDRKIRVVFNEFEELVYFTFNNPLMEELYEGYSHYNYNKQLGGMLLRYTKDMLDQFYSESDINSLED